MTVDEKKKSHNLDRKVSISDPNLTTAGPDYRKSGFPPGITVDELWQYRRKGAGNCLPQDNIHLEEGTFKQLKSEYNRRYHRYYFGGSDSDLPKEYEFIKSDLIKPESSLKLDGARVFRPEYNESFIPYSFERPPRPSQPPNSLEIDYGKMDYVNLERKSESASQFIDHPYQSVPILLKRNTNLKIEGDFYCATESAEKFIEFVLAKRPDLQRHPTTLKLLGDMETTTETRDQFIPYELNKRPPLCKKFTNLHLEGDMDIVTENQDKYLCYSNQKRPPLTKKASNLHLEGDLTFIPEYRREFVDYKIADKQSSIYPVNNLKTDGFSAAAQEDYTNYGRTIHPVIPNLRQSPSSPQISRPPSAKGMRLEDHIEQSLNKAKRLSKSHQNLLLEGRIEMNPEYRNAYIDYGRKSPENFKSRRASQWSYMKGDGKMASNPEYACSYVDFPRQRPSVRRPEGNLSSEGEMIHTTENEKFVSHSNVPKTKICKPDSSLKLEGRFECQPEYRKAYIDYLIREKGDRNKNTRRAYELVNSDTGTSSNEKILSGKTRLPVPLKPTQPPRVPSSSSTSSVPASPKSTKKPPKVGGDLARIKSLSHIESSVFGPKLTVPNNRRSSSRSSSPQPVRKKSVRSRPAYGSDAASTTCLSTDSDVPNAKYKKFGGTLRVENLACRSRSSSPAPVVAGKSKWMRDDSTQSDTAFYILDNDERNNNIVRYGSLKEQKWMPSWY